MFHSYEATVQYLYENLPMFQRIGSAALKNDLTNTIKLCAALGNPEMRFKAIHVAGTNGKGSTSHMIASILQESGYKTGLYTSPHLYQFTERVRVNGVEISRAFVTDFVNRMLPQIEKIQPSFFEITVALAFDYFASSGIDIAVIETGLGGRLDSTNVITPLLSVITNIGWDHKDILGDTLDQIAREKGGIIKPAVPVVVSERQAAIDQVFEEIAGKLSAPLLFASDNFTAEPVTSGGLVSFTLRHNNHILKEHLVMPLQGLYQRKNVVGVMQSIDILRAQGWNIPDVAVWKGLDHIMTNTGLRGRWQILGRRPLKVCDTGHNADGMREVVSQIMSQAYERLHMVVGVVKDKDVSQMLETLPKDAAYYFCQANIPRALDAQKLADLASRSGLKGVVIPDVKEAIRAAELQANPQDMIFIGGSTFVVAEIDNL